MAEICCKRMEDQLNRPQCKHHDEWTCPDVLIVRLYEHGKCVGYGMPIKDGGRSFIKIFCCPFCGRSLLRKAEGTETELWGIWSLRRNDWMPVANKPIAGGGEEMLELTKHLPGGEYEVKAITQEEIDGWTRK